jgi:hypothetical protein
LVFYLFPAVLDFVFNALGNFLIFFSYFELYLFNKLFLFKVGSIKPFMYLIVNFSRLQEFFSFVYINFKLYKAFSSGFLLKVFLVSAKKMRRLIKKHLPVLMFLKKFFLKKLAGGAELWFYGFKKKFLPVISELGAWSFVDSAIWILRKSFGVYRFRRVKAIKKRIRKKLRDK